MDVVLLAVLAVGLVGGVALVEAVIRRSDVGAALVLGIFVVTEVFDHVDLALIASPVRVTPTDVVFAVILTGAIARSLRMRKLTTPQRLFVALLLVMAWSLYRGIDPFGLPGAVNNARRLLRFVAVAFYFSTVEPRRELLNRIGWMWLVMSGAIALVVLARWAGNAAGLYTGFFAGYSSVRVVHSDFALVLSQGAIIALPLYLDRSRGLLRFVAPGLLAFVVLLQHRTVWIVTMLGIVYLLYRQRAVAQRVMAALVASVAVIAALTLTVFDDGEAELSDQLSRSAQSTGTFEWRVAGWQMLLSDSGPVNAEEWVLGRPYGTSWERSFVPGYVIDVSPHNFYLESFLRVGLVGLAIILAIYGVALWSSHVASRHADIAGGLLSPPILHVVVAMQLPYFMTYTPSMAEALLVGLACSMLSDRARSPRQSRRVTALR